MNVLIACEESQRVCVAFRKKGHNAFSCDIQECSGGHPEWHIKGDVLNFLNPFEFMPPDTFYFNYGIPFVTQDGKYHEIIGKWDLIIGHPPCTYMSKAGARWLYTKGTINQDRLDNALAAKEFFLKIYNADCEKICIENPVPLKIIELPKESQRIQPYDYGEKYSKNTCLWLKNLPLLIPTSLSQIHEPYLPSNTSQFAKGRGGSRGVARNAKQASKTFIGIAKAMAEQWGNLKPRVQELEDDW